MHSTVKLIKIARNWTLISRGETSLVEKTADMFTLEKFGLNDNYKLLFNDNKIVMTKHTFKRKVTL